MPYEAAVAASAARSGGGSSGGSSNGESAGDPAVSVNPSKPARVQGEEPRLRAGDDEGKRDLAGENRGGARLSRDRLAADFDPQLTVEDEEGLLVGFVAVQGLL